MATIDTQLKTSKRQLLLHDSLAFLILFVATGVLFAITLFLFRSFTAHRAKIALKAGEDGRVALSQGRPHDAILDLRTALSYSPNQRSYQLLLAEALGQDGRLEEATNYFLNLWESQPGDGFINLQLARLERQRKERQAAINYYRASIFGSWNGDGVVRRRDVRLELANYLIDEKQFALAQTELLIASSNAPPMPDLNIGLGDALVRAEDPIDAMKEYQQAIREDTHDTIAYQKAGRLAYRMGDFVLARGWLERALREDSNAATNAAEPEGNTATLLKNIDRLLVLQPQLATTREDRVRRIRMNQVIAKKRLDACTKQLSSSSPVPVPMSTLAARWISSSSNTTRAALMHDSSNEDLVRSLVYDTEITTATLCGPPQGDDALLLLLAQRKDQ